LRACFLQAAKAHDEAILQETTPPAPTAPSSGRKSQKRNWDTLKERDRLLINGIDLDAFCEAMHFADLPAFANEHVFHIFDHDRNGRIDFKEFMTTLSICHGERPVGHDLYRFYFDVYDVDSSGSISLSELEMLLGAILFSAAEAGAHARDVHEKASELFTKIDTDGDGTISYEEFVRWLESDKTLVESLVSSHLAKSH